MPEIGTLHEALLDELKDLYNAEKQLTKALPKMAKNATNRALSDALTAHLQETQGQVRRLEQYLTKDEIFGLYLNHIYLGHGRYGIEEAARYYFGKKARDLGLEEGATLAGLVASPERYSPRRDETKSRTRRHFVLDQMLAKGFVTKDVWQVARDAPVPLAPATDADSELAPEVVTEVEKLLATLGGARAKRGGYVVTTSIDPVLQAAARKAVRDGLDAYAKRQKVEPPYTLETRRLWGKPATAQTKPQRVAVGRVVSLDDKAGSIEVDAGFARCRVLLRMESRFDPKRRPKEWLIYPKK